MKSSLTHNLAALLLALTFAFVTAPARSAGEPSEYVYVLMTGKDRPKLDYEGDGTKRSAVVKQADPKKPSFEFDLIVVKTPPGEAFALNGTNDKPEHQTIHFSGVIERAGKDEIQVSGSLVAKVAGKIQFVEMQNGTTPNKGDAFPELPFTAGTNSISFKGKVLNWISK